MLYTGLDYHRTFSYITTMKEKGESIGQKKLPRNGQFDFLFVYPSIISAWKTYYANMSIATEAIREGPCDLYAKAYEAFPEIISPYL